MNLEGININKEMDDLLRKLGFGLNKSGKWSHNLILDEEFDFSASSVEGIIKIVFDSGIRAGTAETQRSIVSALGLAN